jgi:hypothetical protein
MGVPGTSISHCSPGREISSPAIESRLISSPLPDVCRKAMIPANPSRDSSCPEIVSSEGGLSLGCPGVAPVKLGAILFAVEGDAWRAPGSMSCARPNAGVNKAARSATEGKYLNWTPVWMKFRDTIALWVASWHASAVGRSKQANLPDLVRIPAVSPCPCRRYGAGQILGRAAACLEPSPCTPRSPTYIRRILRSCAAIPI